MKTGFPKSLKTGEKFCFKTVDRAVYDDNGRPLSDRLAEIKANLLANGDKDNELSARLDNLILASSGDDAALAAAIADLNVGFDGQTYSTPGASVRAQATELYEAIKTIAKYTRDALPIELNVFDNMEPNTGSTELSSGYIVFPRISSVSVPSEYLVNIVVYNYNETTYTYTQIADSGWVNKYPIPKNNPIVIKLKHADGSVIRETESIVMQFVDEYPDTLKNNILQDIGLYESLQYKSPQADNDAFDTAHISTDHILITNKVFFVHAKTGYKCNVVRYNDDDTVFYDHGWQDKILVAARNPFTLSFARIDGAALSFDEFINNFSIEEVHVDNAIMNHILNTVQFTKASDDLVNGYAQYVNDSTWLVSEEMTFAKPTTFYVDYSDNVTIAVQIPLATDHNLIEYNTTWGGAGCKVVTAPANLPCRIAFTYEWMTSGLMDIEPLYNVRVTEGSVIDNENPFVKSIARKGLCAYAPENTLAAFEFARLQGFKYIETDIRFTSDGYPVLIDDATIDRTCNDNKTGTVANMLYETLVTYNFGYDKLFGHIFTDSKILKFDEFVVYCRKYGIYPYVELKSEITTSQIDHLLYIASVYGMSEHITWTSMDLEVLKLVVGKDPHARVGVIYVTALNTSMIDNACLLKNDTNEVIIATAFSLLQNELVTESASKGIPIEVHTVNWVNEIDNLHPYISGVISDRHQAGKYMMRAK